MSVRAVGQLHCRAEYQHRDVWFAALRASSTVELSFDEEVIRDLSNSDAYLIIVAPFVACHRVPENDKFGRRRHHEMARDREWGRQRTQVDQIGSPSRKGKRRT